MRANASSTSPPDDHQALQDDAEGISFLSGLTSRCEAAAFHEWEFANVQRRPNEAGSKTLGVWLFGLQVVWRRPTPTWRRLRRTSVDSTRHAMARSIVLSGDVGCDRTFVQSRSAADLIGRMSAPNC